MGHIKALVLIGLVSLFVGCGGSGGGGSASGGNPNDEIAPAKILQVAKITADDGIAGDNFGLSAAIDGDYVLVGAYKAEGAAKESGVAYLFKRHADNTLTQISKLTASDGRVGEDFGSAVAIYGDYMVIGARYSDNDAGSKAGSAYLFKRQSNDTVIQIAEITADDANSNDFFGMSVAMQGEFIAIGATGDDDIASSSGAVYLFKHISDSNITQVGKLTIADGVQNDRFGNALAMNEEHLLVGTAVGEETGGGVAYLFERHDDTFSQIAKLSVDDAPSGYRFGASVAMDDELMVIGGYGDVNAEPIPAYLFKRNSDNSVTQLAKFGTEEGVIGDYFAESVAISGNTIVVGAYGDEEHGKWSGSAYVFKVDDDYNVTQVKKLSDPDGDTEDYYGYPVVASGDYIAVGASGDGAGSVSLFGTNIRSGVYLLNSNNNYEVDENLFSTVPITTLYGTAYETGDITMALSGADAGSFSIENGALSFVSDLDYEMPTDANVDNHYDLQVTLQDTQGNTINKAFSISVKDKKVLAAAKAMAGDGESEDWFGYSVAVSGEYVLVGSYLDDDADRSSGSAYLFKRQAGNTLVEVAKITADDEKTYAEFGYSVAMDGEYMVIGARNDYDDVAQTGSVYVFKRNSDESVTQLAKLRASDGGNDDEFGHSVTIDGDYLLIGARHDDDGENNSGSAFLFKRYADDNISQIAKLKAEDPGNGDEFGWSVGIDGNYMIVGAYRDDVQATDTGSAYLFKRNSDENVTQVAKLVASDRESHDLFGNAVAIHGNYVLVGANGDDTISKDSGSAYLFKLESNNSVTEVMKITPDDAGNIDYFGRSVAMNANHIVIGAYGDNSYMGSAYLFERHENGSVTQLDKFDGFDAQDGDRFGWSIGLDGNQVVVGAYNNKDKGSAYLFEIEP